MKRLLIASVIGLLTLSLFNCPLYAQEVNNNNVKVEEPVSDFYKNTDWILLGQTKAYKAVDNQVTGDLYVRFIAGKFFYKFTRNEESCVVNPILSDTTKNLEFREILNNSNAVVTMRDGRFFLAVPTW